MWDDEAHPTSTPHPSLATVPEVQWDDEVSTPQAPRTPTPQSVPTPTQPVKPAPVQVSPPPLNMLHTDAPNMTHEPQPYTGANAKPVVQQNAEPLIDPQTGYPTAKIKAAKAKVDLVARGQGQYTPEESQILKAVDDANAKSAQAASAVNKVAVEPFERMSRAGAEAGRDLATRALVTQPGSEGFNPDQPEQPVTQEEVQQKLKEVPAPVVGIARAAGSVVGGVAADPRMWPLFFVGPEASAAKTAMSVGFSAQMAAGAYQQAGELGKIMDNPDVPQEDKWEAGANAVLSTLMAAQAGGHPAIEAVKARLEEFQKLPPHARPRSGTGCARKRQK